MSNVLFEHGTNFSSILCMKMKMNTKMQYSKEPAKYCERSTYFKMHMEQ